MSDAPSPYVLALGDSLTAGWGLQPAASFAARLEALLGARRPGARVHNAGVSGDTSAGGRARLPRLLAALSRRPDLAIVELGVNDLLRGIPPGQTRANLDAILVELGRCGIPALLATFAVPPALRSIAGGYDGIHAELALSHGVPAVPFFPAGLLGRPELLLADGIHPNAAAIERVAAAFLPAVLAMLEEEPARAA